jgi:Mg/Co/Ni transporter MgtE
MAFTMEDFERQYAKEHFPWLTPEEQREALQSLSAKKRKELLKLLPPETLLGVLSEDQIRQYLDQRAAKRPTKPKCKK